MSELSPGVESHATNKNKLREITRTIVSVYILSVDDFMLMGKQDPAKGGTFPNALRIPGGGIKSNKEGRPQETLLEAAVREVREEVIGLKPSADELTLLPLTANLAAEKTLPTGERVWQNMDLRHFELLLGKPADELLFQPGSDLVELIWASRQERASAELIPGGRELMLEGGYIDPDPATPTHRHAS